MSEINVTPLVDVMLVLLIVFMVTAPLLSVGVKVDLPKTHASTLNLTQKPLIVSLNKKGQLYINEQKTDEKKLLTQISELTNGDKEKRLYVRGDKDISYGKVMNIMGRISQAGYEKVALITEPDNGKAK